MLDYQTEGLVFMLTPVGLNTVLRTKVTYLYMSFIDILQERIRECQ